MKYLTNQAKKELYIKNKELLSILWRLFAGIVTIKDLKMVMTALNPTSSDVTISLAISELEQNGFLQTKQLFNSNMKKVVITSRALATMHNVKSNYVPYFSNTDSLTIKNLFKAQILIHETIPAARKFFDLSSDSILPCSGLTKYLNKTGSTICYRPNEALKYYQFLKHYHPQMFSQELSTIYRYVDISQKAHLVRFTNTDIELSPEDMEYKTAIDNLKKNQNEYMNKRQFYNIDNVLKTSNAMIKDLCFSMDTLIISLYFCQISDPFHLPEKIADVTGYLYFFFQRILSKNLKIKVDCKIYCANEEDCLLAEKELTKKTFDIYTMQKKPYDRYQNLLINRGILPTELDNFTVTVENKMIEDIYRIAL